MIVLYSFIATILIVALIFVAYGREHSWRSFFGDPDLGAVDFSSLRNQGRRNQYLICPPGLCPQAKPAAQAPVFPVEKDVLEAAFVQAALADERVVQVSDGEDGELRFVARTNLMRYPDTVSVRVLNADGGASLAVYSRSQVGRSDLGVNEARVKRWLRRVEKTLKSAK